MKEMMKSDTTGKLYCPSECLRILNVRQIVFYMTHGVQVLDFYPSNDLKTGEPVMVFVVSKKDSQEAYKKWMWQRDNV